MVSVSAEGGVGWDRACLGHAFRGMRQELVEERCVDRQGSAIVAWVVVIGAVSAQIVMRPARHTQLCRRTGANGSSIDGGKPHAARCSTPGTAAGVGHASRASVCPALGPTRGRRGSTGSSPERAGAASDVLEGGCRRQPSASDSGRAPDRPSRRNASATRAASSWRGA